MDNLKYPPKFYIIDQVFEGISKSGDFKIWIGQFIDDFMISRGENCKSLNDTFGVQEKYIALFASLTHALCRRENVPLPEWVKLIKPLKEPFFPSGIENLKAMALIESPPEFKRLNIFVLENILNRA